MFSSLERVFSTFEHVFATYEYKILRYKETYFFSSHQIILLYFASFNAENNVFSVNIRLRVSNLMYPLCNK